jgi:hypothetical protein
MAFCMGCGECLGRYRDGYATEHLRAFPSHRESLVKEIIDPLSLSDTDLASYINRLRKRPTGMKQRVSPTRDDYRTSMRRPNLFNHNPFPRRETDVS